MRLTGWPTAVTTPTPRPFHHFVELGLLLRIQQFLDAGLRRLHFLFHPGSDFLPDGLRSHLAFGKDGLNLLTLFVGEPQFFVELGDEFDAF